VATDDLRRFLDTDPGAIETRLEQLVQGGYLDASPGEGMRYHLSAFGIADGRRRFVEVFSPFLGRERRAVCGDPTCECHTAGEACSRLQDRHRILCPGGRHDGSGSGASEPRDPEIRRYTPVAAEPYFKSMETAAHSKAMAEELGIPQVLAVPNKIRAARDEEAMGTFFAHVGLPLPVLIPADEMILEADRLGC
jgi:hypothetical protein